MVIAGAPLLHALRSAAESPPPAPLAQPFAPDAARSSPLTLTAPPARPSDPITTSAVGPIDNPAALAGGSLKSGLDALYTRNVAGALGVRDGMAQGSLDRQILTWAIAVSGVDGVGSAEILAAARDLSGWPGQAALRRNAERALFKENPPAAAVIARLGDARPLTVEGMIALARAYVATGDAAKARALLGPWWATQRLAPEDEQKVLKEFSSVIAPEDHQRRFIRALYANNAESAKLLAAPAGAQALYAAYQAVERKSPETEKLLAAVEPAWRSDPARLYLEIRYLRRLHRYAEAGAAMLRAPRDAARLVDPDAWWVERRILSRNLFDAGQARLAYDIAAAHGGESPTLAAEAEFHAGWYALRALKQPKLASAHFFRMTEIAAGPISTARAFYWLARASEAGAGGDPMASYRRSAHFGTTFYGQLSAARLGEKAPELLYPEPTEADRARFAARPAIQAIKRLQEVGYGAQATMLYTQLSQELDSVGEVALLASMAERGDNHYVALRIGKNAAARGLDVGALSHPLGAIPASANIGGSGAALAYAIARQESEFNIGAVSKAGARGLLQLLPGTAKGVASRNGMEFSPQKLTTDAAYNATLGAHFLGEQLDRFKGSYILTFAGYNAGPRRAEEWMAKYGDPRGKPIDEVVDWIERIPYSETRNYVQRVMENYEVYKARLTGGADIETDLIYGRR